MNYKELKSTLSSSNIKVSIIGIIVLFLGGLSISYGLTNPKSSMIGLSIFGGLFIGLGLLVLYGALPVLIQIKSDTYPLLKAIKEGQKDYIIWVYNKQINTTAGHGGGTLGSSQNIIFYNKEGKSTEITLGGKTSPDSVIQYLATEFPNIQIGYADDTREAVSKILGKTV